MRRLRAWAIVAHIGFVVPGITVTPSPGRAQGGDAAVEERMRALNEQGVSQARKGEYAAARRSYEDALAMQPDSADLARSRPRRWVQNNLAWLLATAPDSAVRDGARALALAEQLVAWKPDDGAYLDTFAAACAEVGRFDDAVRTQRVAVERIGGAWRDEYRKHLKSYEEGKPWRDRPGLDVGTASADDELNARYDSPPKTLAAPGTPGLLLVTIEMRFPMGAAQLAGAALVSTDSTSLLKRVKSLARRTVLFHDLPPGRYALRFVFAETHNAKLVVEMPADSEFSVVVSPGGISYLGTVTVQKKIGFSPPESRVGRDVERERESWTAFLKKYGATPWADVARARLDSLGAAP